MRFVKLPNPATEEALALALEISEDLLEEVQEVLELVTVMELPLPLLADRCPDKSAKPCQDSSVTVCPDNSVTMCQDRNVRMCLNRYQDKNVIMYLGKSATKFQDKSVRLYPGNNVTM